MATKSEFAERCKELGLTYEIDRDEKVIKVDLPDGKILTELDTHYLDFHYEGWKMSEVYDELLGDLDAGLSDCEDKECDICNK